MSSVKFIRVLFKNLNKSNLNLNSARLILEHINSIRTKFVYCLSREPNNSNSPAYILFCDFMVYFNSTNYFFGRSAPLVVPPTAFYQLIRQGNFKIKVVDFFGSLCN